MNEPYASKLLERAVQELCRLPGVGRKTALRFALYLLKQSTDTVAGFTESLSDLRTKVKHCRVCHNLSDTDVCHLCADPRRDTSRICVVAESRDVSAIERTGAFKGVYHVLGGVINPMERKGPDQLHIRELMGRLGSEDVSEVLIATNPDIEGETTASYLARLIKPLDIEVTRLASGLPVGGELEYADEVTLGRAIEARRQL